MKATVQGTYGSPDVQGATGRRRRGFDVLRIRDSKSEEGIRSIAVSPTLAEALWQQRRGAADPGDGARVFASQAGGIYRAETFKEALEAALVKAGSPEAPASVP